jgi:DNA polymerase-1
MWYGPWPKLAGPDNRLRTIYRQVKSSHDGHDDSGPERGTISGRLAVERWQAQAIPHDYQIPEGIVPIRKMFRARPGHSIVEIDVSQAELRGVAGLAGCTGLLDGFAAGVDGHTRTAQLVFNTDESSPRWDFYRSLAKRLNFAIVYGAGVGTLREQIRVFTGQQVELDEVEGWWSDAKAAMPEIFRYSRRLRNEAEARRQVQLVGGRTRFFAHYEFTHKAMNAVIQGSVAVAMADAMIEVTRWLGPNAILLQIHDSLVCEFPSSQTGLFTVGVRGIICEVFERHFHAPFRADAKTWDAR